MCDEYRHTGKSRCWSRIALASTYHYGRVRRRAGAVGLRKPVHFRSPPPPPTLRVSGSPFRSKRPTSSTLSLVIGFNAARTAFKFEILLNAALRSSSLKYSELTLTGKDLRNQQDQ